MVKWGRLAEGRFKLSTDGLLYNGKGFCGAAIRNYEGEVVRAVHGTCEETTINCIELQTMYMGLQLAQKYGIKNLGH